MVNTQHDADGDARCAVFDAAFCAHALPALFAYDRDAPETATSLWRSSDLADLLRSLPATLGAMPVDQSDEGQRISTNLINVVTSLSSSGADGSDSLSEMDLLLTGMCAELREYVESPPPALSGAVSLGTAVGEFTALLSDEARGIQTMRLLSARLEVIRAAAILDAKGVDQVVFAVEQIVTPDSDLTAWRPEWPEVWLRWGQEKLWNGLIDQTHIALRRSTTTIRYEPFVRESPGLLTTLEALEYQITISVEDAAAMLRKDRTTLYKWMKSRKFPEPVDKKLLLLDVANWARKHREPFNIDAKKEIKERFDEMLAAERERQVREQFDEQGRRHDDKAPDNSD